LSGIFLEELAGDFAAFVFRDDHFIRAGSAHGFRVALLSRAGNDFESALAVTVM
jgi:hypothetical protein